MGKRCCCQEDSPCCHDEIIASEITNSSNSFFDWCQYLDVEDIAARCEEDCDSHRIWELIEVGASRVYCHGVVDCDGTLISNPKIGSNCNCPFRSIYPYNGYMQLRVRCYDYNDNCTFNCGASAFPDRYRFQVPTANLDIILTRSTFYDNFNDECAWFEGNFDPINCRTAARAGFVMRVNFNTNFPNLPTYTVYFYNKHPLFYGDCFAWDWHLEFFDYLHVNPPILNCSQYKTDSFIVTQFSRNAGIPAQYIQGTVGIITPL